MRANAVKNSPGFARTLSMWDYRAAISATHAWRTKEQGMEHDRGIMQSHGSILGGNEYLEIRNLLTSLAVLWCAL